MCRKDTCGLVRTRPTYFLLWGIVFVNGVKNIISLMRYNFSYLEIVWFSLSACLEIYFCAKFHIEIPWTGWESLLIASFYDAIRIYAIDDTEKSVTKRRRWIVTKSCKNVLSCKLVKIKFLPKEEVGRNKKIMICKCPKSIRKCLICERHAAYRRRRGKNY